MMFLMVVYVITTQVLPDIDNDGMITMIMLFLMMVKCDNNKISPVAACDHQVKMMPLGIDNLVLIDDEVNFDHQYKIAA